MNQFELVPSKWMRKYLKDNKRDFTDWEKATLIWNSPVCTWKEMIEALKELADTTSDERLKQQVIERVEREERSYKLLYNNSERKYVYVVIDNEHFSCGFFADFDQAVSFSVDHSKKYECKCFIEKQLIFSEKTKNDVVHPWISDQNIIKEMEPGEDYDGVANA